MGDCGLLDAPTLAFHICAHNGCQACDVITRKMLDLARFGHKAEAAILNINARARLAYIIQHPDAVYAALSPPGSRYDWVDRG